MSIVETGTSLMEIDCHSLVVVISFSLVQLRELIFVILTMLMNQLVYITVILKLLLVSVVMV